MGSSEEKQRGGRRVARSIRTKRKGFTRPASFDERKFLALVKQVLTGEQIEVLIWYFVDGHDMPQIGELLGCTKEAVNKRLNVIEKRLANAGLPLPHRAEHPYATDSVSNYNL